MAENLLTIPKTPELDSSEDYTFLRKEGMQYIEKLSRKLWTDYNSHDPGITIHELLCYAISDMGYRTSFSIPDLLTGEPESGEDISSIRNFFTAKQILPVNPTTETDIRKIIMDVPGVKNAWLSVATDYEKPVFFDHKHCAITLNIAEGDSVMPITGLYNVMLQYEENNLRKEEYDVIRNNVKARLMATRNLCEDYLSVSQVQYEDIAVCSDIEVRQDADVTKLQAKIFQLLIDYFSPPVNFYTLEEMVDKGKTIDDIFEGPLLNSGFIDDEELEKATLRTTLYTSDLYNLIMDMPEVVAVKSLKLILYINGEQAGEEEAWELTLGKFHSARLEKLKSKFTFYKGVLPYMANAADVEDELRQLQQVNGKFRKKGHLNDIEIPEGSFRDLTDYYPVQNEFPAVYGIGPAGLSHHVTDERKAQANQLKAYLLFYEQLLTNFLAQLANIKRIFSFKQSVDRDVIEYMRMQIDQLLPADIAALSHSDYGIRSKTYFTQALQENDIADLAGLFSDGLANYPENVYNITETPEEFSKRRNRFLDHLLARFAEDMTEYSLTLFQMYGKNTKGDLFAGLRIAGDKEALLNDYPKLSRDRGKGFNYKPEKPFIPEDPSDAGIWGTSNIAGMKHRVARLLGMQGKKLDYLALQHLLIIGSGPNKKTKPFRVKLFDSDNTTVLLESENIMSKKEAEARREAILWAAFDPECFFKSADGVLPATFSLVDCCAEGMVLATSPEYASEEERDAALLLAESFFSNNRMVDVITRRTIATTLLDLKSKVAGSDKNWWVELADPNAPTDYLLSSGLGEGGENLFVVFSNEPEDEHDWSKPCAESLLLYMLHNGDNPGRYDIQLDPDSGKYYYMLLSDCDVPVAFSKAFDMEEDCRAQMEKCTIRFFRDNCDIEDFHLIEHLLLRPRTNLDQLLPACVACNPRPELHFEKGEPKFTFEVYKLLEKEESLEGLHGALYERLRDAIKTQKSKKQIKAKQKDADHWGFLLTDQRGWPVLVSEGYVELNSCTNGIASVRWNGINTTIPVHAVLSYGDPEKDYYLGNYRVFPRNGKYRFHLYSDNARVIAESASGYDSPEEAVGVILELANYLAFQEDIIPETDPCITDDDPYSFRISVILPAWPTRFRSQYFRKYVEKVIRQETPAHIYPKICWVNLEQMRDFERHYKHWLQSLSSNEIPNPKTTAALIDSMYSLKNIYPVAVLHSCEDVSGDDPQVILDNTSLGNL